MSNPSGQPQAESLKGPRLVRGPFSFTKCPDARAGTAGL